MPEPDVSYRLTFNKPAGRQFLVGYAGVAITLDRKEVLFRPMRKVRGDNCVTLVPRGERGGFEATIDGTEAKTLLRALLREATPAHPFFLLSKSPDDPQVLRLEHYTKDDAPPKIEPHVRLWPPQPKAKERRAAAAVVQQAPKKAREGVFGVFDEVRKAHAVIMDHAGNRRIGRPTRELEMAKAIMAEFESLTRDIRPSPLDGIELSGEQREVIAGVMQSMAKAMLGQPLAPAASPPPVAMMPVPVEAPRRRGRPPKAVAETEVPKRGRGRPRKVVAEPVAEPPRRRGRPRKNVEPVQAPSARKVRATAGSARKKAATQAVQPPLLPSVAEDDKHGLPPAPVVSMKGAISAPLRIAGDDEQRVVETEDDDLTPDQRDLILNTKALTRMSTGRGKGHRA